VSDISPLLIIHQDVPKDCEPRIIVYGAFYFGNNGREKGKGINEQDPREKPQWKLRAEDGPLIPLVHSGPSIINGDWATAEYEQIGRFGLFILAKRQKDHHNAVRLEKSTWRS
jgi:hypothetical protein